MAILTSITLRYECQPDRCQPDRRDFSGGTLNANAMLTLATITGANFASSTLGVGSKLYITVDYHQAKDLHA